MTCFNGDLTCLQPFDLTLDGLLEREGFTDTAYPPIPHSLIEPKCPGNVIRPDQLQLPCVRQVRRDVLDQRKLAQRRKNLCKELPSVSRIPPVMIEPAGVLGIIPLHLTGGDGAARAGHQTARIVGESP